MKLKLFILCCILQSIVGAKVPSIEVGHPPLPPHLSPRIVGGVDAEEGQAPFQCSLQKSASHYCGCAIISSKYILTAAHCVAYPAQSIEVVVGTNQWSSGGTRYKVKRTTAHEDYNSPPFAYDIGLIEVQGEIEFSDLVQPIKISSSEVPAGASLQATGWGRLSAGGPLPTNLQILNLTAISLDECQGKIREAHESHLCTESPVGEGVCNGDSGGPLIFNNELVGLDNFAVPCGRGYPDGFASIAYFYDWIQEHTGA